MRRHLLLFTLLSMYSICRAQHTLSVSYTPALTRVDISNFERFALEGFTKDLYLKERPSQPLQGYIYGARYSYRFKNRFAVGIGLFKSFKQSSTSQFYLRSTSKNKVRYLHNYRSYELATRFQYGFKPRRLSPVVAVEIGSDYFQKTEMRVYSVDNETGEEDNSLTETHFGYKQSMVKFSTALLAGMQWRLHRYVSLSLLPELRFYTGSFSMNRDSFRPISIEGNLWLLGVQSQVSFYF